ncbi:WD40 repeat [Arabidopsis thaliana x Arabidopsis arenosa]|uniref:WD40 repeat n=1 Tax=Arabidopsis thaliana x Arabidopsis arenosa TaxID=1240361 RepID=A0A8T2EVG0_9BRAS|nr:WD40 repeat [Arabidopsis thaliana x Arabidopsis arenosa]
MIRGGRNNITSAPAFSKDAKKLLLCTANTVSVYSVATGLKITSLEDHTAPVTSVIVDPSSDETVSYCWTSSLDGKIRIWEFSAPKLLKIFDTHLPIHSLVMIPVHVSHSVIAYVSVEDYSSVSKDLFGQIRRYDLTQDPLHSGDTLKEMEEPKPIVLSPSGEFFGVCHNCTIHIWNVASEHLMPKETTLHHTELITVFAFHPNQRILAAGDVTGRVLIWKDNGIGEFTSVKTEDDTESCTTFNWHSAQVTVLNFSSDGALLYSGVKAGDFVVWELGTGKKQLLPKIGSPLLYFIFSSDSTLSSVICEDNQIHLLKMPSMEILRTISGIKPPTPERHGFICYVKTRDICLTRTVSIDRSSGIAAFCTANHRVQLYNLLSDHDISEVQICDHHPDDGDEVRVLVTAVALSRNGSVMTTAEARFAGSNFSEGIVSLKFWVFVPDSKTFSLSTVINQPHREAAITAIALNPARSMAVSISSAGDFKIWVCSSDKNLTPEDSNWICHGVGSYKRTPITAAVFSGDGSCLALAAKTVITIWHPLKNELLYVVGKANAPIMELSFTGGGFLIAASHGSTPHLSVWDLMTFCLSWSYRLYIEVLTWLPESDRLVKSNEQIFRGKDGAILLFDGSGPKPVAIWTVMKARGGTLSFVEDGKKSQPLLAYVNRSHEYVLFDPYSDEKLETSAIDYEVFLAAISKKKKRSRKKALMSEKPWETMFCGSTLNFPPFPDLCASFFSSRMQKEVCERADRQPERHSS